MFSPGRFIHHSCLLLILLLPASAAAQFPVIDSVKQRLYSAGTTKEKLFQLKQLLQYRNSLNADTLIYYAAAGKQIASAQNDPVSLAWFEYYSLAGELAKGKTDSIVYKLENDPVLRQDKRKDPSLYYKIMLLKANALNRLNDRTSALELQLSLLNEAEKDNDIQAMCFVLNYIGATYLNINKSLEARNYWLKALQLISNAPSVKLKEIEAVVSSNMTLYYYNQYQTGTTKAADSFLYYCNTTITICRQYAVYSVLATALAHRGNYYGSAGNFAAGEHDLGEAVLIRNKIGDPLYIMNDLINLAAFYYYKKDYDRCISITDTLLAVAGKNHIVAEKQQVLALMSAAYKAKGDFKKYSETLERFIAYTDSSARINAQEKIAAVEARYQVQKKEAMIATQRLQLFRRNAFIAGAAVITLLAALLLHLAFRRYKNKQQQQMRQAIEEEQTKKHTAVKEAEENERKRIAAELHDNMGVQANAILHNSSMLAINAANNNQLIVNLQDTAKEMLGNLRETVWALKTTEVSTIDTWHRIVGFIKQMQRYYPAMCFELEGQSPSQSVISSVRALHIIMVVKESVNNAVKHAAASLIKTESMINANQQWIIRISDNGKGFNPDEINKTDSNGLQHMNERAVAGSFKLLLHSEKGAGTIVELQIAV